MLNCQKCKFKRNIPGDAHISCSRKNTKIQNINPTGVQKGWFFFPLNYDPIWAEGCDSFIQKDIDLENLSDKQLYIIFNFEKERTKLLETNKAAFRDSRSIEDIYPKDNEVILKKEDRSSLIKLINETWTY